MRGEKTVLRKGGVNRTCGAIKAKGKLRGRIGVGDTGKEKEINKTHFSDSNVTMMLNLGTLIKNIIKYI